MNRMDRALIELGEMDELAAGNSRVHRLHPLAKLLTTVAYIAVVVSFHKYALAALVPLALYPVALFQLCGIPVRACLRKLRVALPLVLAVGLLNPLFDKTPALILGNLTVTGGALSMLALMLKGACCLTASFLLMATTPVDSLCAALRKLRVPPMLVTLLLLTYRYVGVMTREVAVMTDAYRLRAPGQRGVHVSAWGSFLGQLLLRSMDRAEALYASMRLRGFSGSFFYADVRPFGAGDALWLVGWAAAFALLRWVNVAQLVGGLVVR